MNDKRYFFLLDEEAEKNGISSAQNAALTQEGFTLIELLVAMALGIFLIGGLLLTYGAGRSSSLQAENLSRVQENIRFASDFLIRDVRNAGFRDQLILTFNQYNDIGANFASIDEDAGGSELIVRYAGRGSCGRTFQAGVLQNVVENRYLVDNGGLFCEGTEIAPDGTRTTFPEVQLAAGVQATSFEFLYADGAPPPVSVSQCSFGTQEQLQSACVGVRAKITFQDDPQRQVELVAAFRNVIVDRVYGR